jgi:fructose-specific phosphotransferase system IIA component
VWTVAVPPTRSVVNFLEITPGARYLAGFEAAGRLRVRKVCPEETEMKISDLLNEKVIKVGLESEEKEEAFEELIDLLVRDGRLTDRDAAREAILEREEKQSTGIGRGVAIPHGKSDSIEELTAALGTSPDGIEYDSLDGEPVSVVFLLLANAHNPGPHIEALAQVATLFKIPGFIERLVDAESNEELYRIIRTEEEREENGAY